MPLQRVLCAYGNDVILVVTQLTAPAASLANPFDQTWLVRALHRSITSTRAQQLPLLGPLEADPAERGADAAVDAAAQRVAVLGLALAEVIRGGAAGQGGGRLPGGAAPLLGSRAARAGRPSGH